MRNLVAPPMVNGTDLIVRAAKLKRSFRNHHEQATAISVSIRSIVDDIEKHDKRGNHSKVVKLQDLLDQQLALREFHLSQIKD